MHGCNRPSRTHRALPSLPPRTINHTRYRTPNFKFGKRVGGPPYRVWTHRWKGAGVFPTATRGPTSICKIHRPCCFTYPIDRVYWYEEDIAMFWASRRHGLEDVTPRSRGCPCLIAAPRRSTRSRRTSRSSRAALWTATAAATCRRGHQDGQRRRLRRIDVVRRLLRARSRGHGGSLSPSICRQRACRRVGLSQNRRRGPRHTAVGEDESRDSALRVPTRSSG